MMMVNNGFLKKWLPVLLAFAMLLSGLAPTIGTNGSFHVTEGVAECNAPRCQDHLSQKISYASFFA